MTTCCAPHTDAFTFHDTPHDIAHDIAHDTPEHAPLPRAAPDPPPHPLTPSPAHPPPPSLDALLLDYLSAALPLPGLAARHALTLNQLLDTTESPDFLARLERVEAASARRATAIARAALSDATFVLTELAARYITGDARPDPARKAANSLHKLAAVDPSPSREGGDPTPASSRRRSFPRSAKRPGSNTPHPDEATVAHPQSPQCEISDSPPFPPIGWLDSPPLAAMLPVHWISPGEGQRAKPPEHHPMLKPARSRGYRCAIASGLVMAAASVGAAEQVSWVDWSFGQAGQPAWADGLTQILTCSRSVTNPPMAIVSLGNSRGDGVLEFDAPIDIISRGHGVIQCIGASTEITRPAPTLECGHGSTTGLLSAGPEYQTDSNTDRPVNTVDVLAFLNAGPRTTPAPTQRRHQRRHQHPGRTALPESPDRQLLSPRTPRAHELATPPWMQTAVGRSLDMAMPRAAPRIRTMNVYPEAGSLGSRRRTRGRARVGDFPVGE
ncbi:MAG: hypothetical protein IPJ41_06485 [Phycisphaerales bacterium]|nr:hypothetical protein [Phycisphaerales bacterium]